MKATTQIIRYELKDVIRSKWVILYTLFFLIITDTLFRFGGDNSKVILSLMNVVLIFIPLISIIFGTMYVYHSREFIELLLCQPIHRRSLFFGMYNGLVFPLSAGFSLGIAIPFSLHGFNDSAQLSMFLTLVTSGILLTLVFIAMAFLISVKYEDRVKGLGVSILLWLFFTVIYDSLVLLATFLFKDYPLEKPLIAFMLLNPIDLARTLLLLKFDISALMGYTGAVFENFFGSQLGMGTSLFFLMIWVMVPFAIGLRKFIKKDF